MRLDLNLTVLGWTTLRRATFYLVLQEEALSAREATLRDREGRAAEAEALAAREAAAVRVARDLLAEDRQRIQVGRGLGEGLGSAWAQLDIYGCRHGREGGPYVG